MFILSVRAATVKFFAVILVGVLALGGVIVYNTLPPEEEAMETVSYSGIKTEEDRRAFLAELGWQVSGDAVDVGEFTVPESFDRVLAGYNEIQRRQGLDLSRYAKKTVTRYTYEVTNYDGYDGKVYANIIVYRGKVVAGDLCSADSTGFVTGLDGK